MGLFSSSSKTYVSSVTYPLGDDDPNNQVDFAKYLVLNALMQGKDVGGSLTRGYLTGGGMKFRSGYRYARDKYAYRLPHTGMLYCASPDRAVVVQTLTQIENQSGIYLNNAVIAVADFAFWAERHLAQKYGYDRLSQKFMHPPEGVHEDATVSYDIEPNGSIRILLMNPDLSARVLNYYPRDLVSGGLYLHAVYQLVQEFPTEIETTTRDTQQTDTAGTTTVESTRERASELQEITTKTTVTIADGKTTTTVEKTVRTMSRPKYFLYLLGAGTYPAMDEWRTDETIVNSPFYPSVPLRVDNVDFTDSNRKHQPSQVTGKKLMSRLGVNYNDIADNLRDNPQINEIDFAFLQIGVALNTKTQEGKRYVYEFFKMLQNRSAVTQAHFDAWDTERVAAEAAMEQMGGATEENGVRVPPPGFSSAGLNSPPVNKLVFSHPAVVNKQETLNVTIDWQWANTTQHSGNLFEGAIAGDCITGVLGDPVSISLLGDMVVDNSVVYACRQLPGAVYEMITVSGLVHNNLVYQGKSVVVTAYEALTDPNQEGFILPLSYQLFYALGMKRSTQLSYECVHLVLNCYQVLKKKWYQKGVFKVLLVALAVVFTVISMGSGTPLATAMIAAAGKVAAVLGIHGILAAFIVATATVFAGMVLTKLLTPVFTDLFGEKWGRVLLVIASALAMNFAQTGSMLGSASAAGSTTLTATQIINGTGAVLKAYGAYNQGALTELSLAGMELAKAQKEEMDELTAKIKELDTGSDLIDIQGLIDSTNMRFEGPEDFFARTLMTGSDVVELTLGQINHFADLGLQLPNTG